MLIVTMPQFRSMSQTEIDLVIAMKSQGITTHDHHECQQHFKDIHKIFEIFNSKQQM